MKKGLIITGIILLIIVSFVLYVYNVYINPSADKPFIERPELPGQSLNGTSGNESNNIEVGEEHIQFLVNEIGAYNLHDDPLSNEEAVMEFLLEDRDETYTITIIDNYPEVTLGAADNPDIRLHADHDVLLELLQADDFEKAVVEYVDVGKMWIEVLADEGTLALKGYKTIYDRLSEGSDMPTGQFIKSFDEKLVWR